LLADVAAHEDELEVWTHHVPEGGVSGGHELVVRERLQRSRPPLYR
jgi:hypothetical protein